MDNQDDVFGSNKKVHLPEMIHMKDMDPVYLPHSSKPELDTNHKERRLIFIGDIHGHMKELQALLSKAKYHPKRDHIIALGDMINKGPDSTGVVDFLMAQGASCVRGNHEDRILLLANSLAAAGLKQQTESADLDSTTKLEVEAKARDEEALARELTRKQLEWLSECPVILRVGQMDPFGHLVAVHAGLVPGVELKKQDPVSVMNMRIVDLKTHTPSHKHSEKGSIPWAEFWNKQQKLMSAKDIFSIHGKQKHMTVVYGHDAKRGLQIDTYTKGLDSGCGNGKDLTAWIVGSYGREELVQVPNHKEAQHE